MSSTRRLVPLPFQRPPAGVRDVEAKDLNGLATEPYDLGLCHRESFTYKTGKNPGGEPIRCEDRIAEAGREYFENITRHRTKSWRSRNSPPTALTTSCRAR